MIEYMHERVKVEVREKWRERLDSIPYIQFPSDWKVQIIPPFGGAITRFRITKDGKKEFVSIYLDWYEVLGIYGEPYWEVYPHGEDVFRCPMNDTKALIYAITKSLKEIG